MRYQTVHIKERSQEAGNGDPKALRASGRLPAVLSRPGHEALSLSVSRDELARAVHRTGVGGIMSLVDEDKQEKHLGLLKELQWHPVSKRLLHASFQEVRQDQVITTSVPVILVGEPIQVKNKTGQLIKNQESIDIHAKVLNLPDHVVVDISDLVVGDVVTAEDLVLLENCEAAHPEAVICSVTTPTIYSLEVPKAEEEEAVEVPVAAEEGEEAPAEGKEAKEAEKADEKAG